MGIYSVISVTFFFNGVSETASSRGLTIPDMLFAAFQMMFSIICVAILTGSVLIMFRARKERKPCATIILKVS